MTVEGLFNPSHMIRTCLSHEYAFSIVYPTREVRIGHHRGIWTLVKLKGKEIEDHIDINDAGSGYDCANELTSGLFDELQTDAKKKTEVLDRGDDAKLIEKFLRIWGGKTSGIRKISVVQPGRNADVSVDTGEFYISPREEEFCQ